MGFTQNLIGWFFGFKVRIAINKRGLLTAFSITKANKHDRRQASRLINKSTHTLVGDSHYGGKPLKPN